MGVWLDLKRGVGSLVCEEGEVEKLKPLFFLFSISPSLFHICPTIVPHSQTFVTIVVLELWQKNGEEVIEFYVHILQRFLHFMPPPEPFSCLIKSCQEKSEKVPTTTADCTLPPTYVSASQKRERECTAVSLFLFRVSERKEKEEAFFSFFLFPSVSCPICPT